MRISALEQFRAQAAEMAEELLIRTAIRLELPSSLHLLAIERYEAIRKHIERAASPLKDRVRLFYPQGSMAIRATIRAPWRDDGYDIDIVAELILPIDLPPAVALDLLYAAIRGEPGSRYYDVTKRQTRCVTVNYVDGMHLDVTPSILVSEAEPRLSVISHAKPEEPATSHFKVVINSHAFAEHVRLSTPVDLTFQSRYAREVKRFTLSNRPQVKADAEVEEVPEHSSEVGGKSATIVALQLLKAFRNERYRGRKAKRMPPSVMMTKHAVDIAQSGWTLVQALTAISMHIVAELEAAQALSMKIDVRNPKCELDRFTDRWPESLADQIQFIQDLKLFQRQLQSLTAGELSLPELQELLSRMFGIGPARSAVDDLARTLGREMHAGESRVGQAIGGVRTAAAAFATPKIVSPRVPAHSFYGSQWQKPQKR